MKYYLPLLVSIFSFQAFGQSRSEKIAWINAKFRNATAMHVISVENNANALDVVSEKKEVKYLKKIFEIEENGTFTVTDNFYHTLGNKPTKRVAVKGHLRKLAPNIVFSGTFLVHDSTMTFYVGYSSKKERSVSKKKDNHPEVVYSNDLELGPINAYQDQGLVDKIIITLKELITSFGGKNKSF